MNAPNPSVHAQSPPAGVKLDDIFYVLFRHKWKILLFTLAGVLAGAGIYFFMPVKYTSEAKLLVRYIRDSKTLDAGPDASASIRSPDSRGDGILASELEILTSRDLALQVVDSVGADRILAAVNGETNRQAAAGVVLRGLEVDVPRRGSIMRVQYSHPDADMAQTVLRQLVQSYLRRHAEVHRAVGVFDDVLTRQTDDLRSRLAQTEADLRRLLLSANVSSVEETKRLLLDQTARARQELVNVEAELAQRRTIVRRLEELAGTPASATDTNAEPAIASPTGPIDPDKERLYRSILSRLEALRTRELDLLVQFTPESQDVSRIRNLIETNEQTRQQLETEEPRLRFLATRFPTTTPSGSASLTGVAPGSLDLMAEQAQIAALESRADHLKSHIDNLRDELSKVLEAEPAIADLQRRRDLQEANYRYFSSNLEQARINASLGTTTPNINIVQDAAVPRIASDKTRKYALMALLGFVGTGFGLAFLLDFGLDRSVKRPVEIERTLRLPLFLTIPDFTRNGHSQAFRRYHKALAKARKKGQGNGAANDGDTSLLPARNLNPLDTFHEALRDRLIMYFQLKEMTHKPKLVGVTSTHRQAGVSSIAAGLAEHLSETGDGNVLLVNMNPVQGPEMQPFHRGQPGCNLTQALEESQAAHVQDNLYAASLNDPASGRVGIVPTRFANLMPKMKASDYDYIIFDMPPVSQTSVTAKIAGLLDLTFLVVEAERTQLDQANRTLQLLGESRASVAAVLNRYHNYLPGTLSTDI